ncbi:MAG: TerB family tellurite resistance protein [Endomicrobiales bacterium]|nr:TerB family tellurite resistance protein [Endomicrobiales bacterium]
MIDLIKRLLGIEKDKKEDSGEEKSSRLKMAVCVLLLEVAYCDEVFSDPEREKLSGIIKGFFDLKDKEINELINAAKKQKNESVELWKYTNLINNNFSHEDKVKLIEVMWEIIYADNVLNKHEDYMVHKLSDLLHLSQREFIDAKLKVKNKKSQNLQKGDSGQAEK